MSLQRERITRVTNLENVTIHTTLDTSRIVGDIEAAQKWLDNEILKDCDPYVPVDSFRMRDSGQANTTLGSGKILFRTPYVRPQYYRSDYNHGRDNHPQASAMWFEKAKATRRDHWLRGFKQMAGGNQ